MFAADYTSGRVAPRWSSRAFLFGAAAVTAAFVWFGTGLHPVWWLTWFVPLPLAAVTPSVRARAALLAALGAWAIGDLNLWSYAVGAVGIPLPMALVTLAVAALIFAAPVLLFRALAMRRRYVLAVLAAAGAAAGLDWAESMVSPNGAFSSLAVTQADQGWLLPVVAIGGGWVITALIWAFAASGAVLLRRDLPGRRAGAGSIAVICTVIAALVMSVAGYLLARPDSGEMTTVAAITAPVPGDDPPWLASPAGREVLDGTLGAVRQARATGATAAVVSESTLRVDARQLHAVTARIRHAAGPRLSVVVGLVVRSRDGSFRNDALLVSPGHPVATYTKQHLVPGRAEHGLVAGDKPLSVIRHGQTWGVAICKDLDFPGVAREYGQAGADLMLGPAWDFAVDGWYHSRMAMVAAAGNGLPMVRATRDGKLTVSDATGSVIAQRPSHGTTAAVLTARVPARGAETPYAHFGDWFAYLGLLLAAAGVWLATRPVKASTPARDNPGAHSHRLQRDAVP